MRRVRRVISQVTTLTAFLFVAVPIEGLAEVPGHGRRDLVIVTGRLRLRRRPPSVR
jgi:hypothetical protein